MDQKTNRIAFQGDAGAYSHEACRTARPDTEAMPCRPFEEVIDAVNTGQADLATLPTQPPAPGGVGFRGIPARRVAAIGHIVRRNVFGRPAREERLENGLGDLLVDAADTVEPTTHIEGQQGHIEFKVSRLIVWAGGLASQCQQLIDIQVAAFEPGCQIQSQ